MEIRWNTAAMTNKSKEPVRASNKIKIGQASNTTPCRATTPAGGCKQRNPWTIIIADVTARQLTRADAPKKATKVTERDRP